MTPTRYWTVAIDGVNVFYRQAGRSDRPAVLLLHGFPSDSVVESANERGPDTTALAARAEALSGAPSRR
jgi:pimeloyl-ACP methyl ester carboxylesterase